MDITLRDCGFIGWLGLYIVNGKEIYRTGRHHKSAQLALEQVQKWLSAQEEV